MAFLNKEQIAQFYQTYQQKVQQTRQLLQRPLTYTEKILYTHMAELKQMQRGASVALTVDRVAMQDATAQMAILQFMLAGKQKVAVPTTVHCDHLIQAAVGAQEDLQQAILQNDEVYQFLKSAANKYNMGFWKPGAGIIHQVVLENYAVPGMLMIGTDSHTPNAGGLGMVAIGVGGADAVDAMVGQAWKVSMPKLIGVHLKGKLNGWTAPKDIILKVAELLTVKGGTGHIVEYFGEGTETISATGKATITNMGAEIGATTSLFPYDKKSADYLGATRREFVAEQANQQDLRADKEVEENPEDYFDQVLTIDLNQLKPYVNGPFSPDYARPISKLGEEAKKNDWPIELTYGLIGSCTNSSYEDMERAASIAEQAAQHGLVAKSGFMVTPGSEQIHQTIKRDGQMASFQKIGGVVLANACGPCIGQWKREDMKEGEKNSIITSYNRNFKKRNDGNPHTHGFVASPEIVTALVLAGRLDFNPLTDALETPEGTTFTLKLPVGKELPETSFVFDTTGYEQPTGEGEVVVNPKSERLALLEPFTSWKENDFENLFVLVKAKGKCTTDHISPAGKWLKYRGHLDNISNNMYSGAVNDFRDEVGKGKNQLSGEIQEYSTIARAYKAAGRGWLVVGDSNYGEGSSREHAAMEPRHLGCRVVVAKSFARIAETNLKKQGVLPLHFIHEEDFQKILEDDQVTVDNIDLVVGQEIHLIITHADESLENIPTTHTLTEEQIAWFNSGSALEWMRKNNQ